MLLDKQIRAKVVEILKADTGVLTLVDEANILNFPSSKVDMEFTPAISVFTLNTTDNSEYNNSDHDNVLTVHIEVTCRDIDAADDIENLVNEALVQDLLWDTISEELSKVQKPYFSASEVNYDDLGDGIRVSKSTLYMFKYQSPKGKITDIDELLIIAGEMVYENDVESQLDNEVLINY